MAGDNIVSTNRALKILTAEFPGLDDEVSTYISSILETPEDIHTEDDLYEAIGELLLSLAPDKNDSQVRKTLRRILKVILKESDNFSEEKFTLLEAPISLRDQMDDEQVGGDSGILGQERSLVDKQKLEKAENKSKQKQARRDEEEACKPKESIVNADFRPTLNQVSTIPLINGYLPLTYTNLGCGFDTILCQVHPRAIH